MHCFPASQVKYLTPKRENPLYLRVVSHWYTLFIRISYLTAPKVLTALCPRVHRFWIPVPQSGLGFHWKAVVI